MDLHGKYREGIPGNELMGRSRALTSETVIAAEAEGGESQRVALERLEKGQCSKEVRQIVHLTDGA